MVVMNFGPFLVKLKYYNLVHSTFLLLLRTFTFSKNLYQCHLKSTHKEKNPQRPLFHFHCSDPIKAAELAFERAAEAAARAAEQGEIEEEEDTGPKPILPYSSFFILSSTNP